MRWTVGLSEEAVKVQVENCWVTLRGQVARLSVSHER